MSTLLTLVSDQYEKLKKKTELNPQLNIIPIYLDAFKTNNDIEALVHALMQTRNDYAVIIFTSPQTITTKFHNFIFSMLQTIKFVVLDEIHVFHSFGRSFRSEFNLL